MFGDRDELIWPQQSQLRVLPANQRFYRVDRTGLAFYLRLIVQQKLKLANRFAYARFHCQRLESGLVQTRQEKLEVAAAAFFRQIHRRIGIANQRLRRFAIFRKNADADRTRYRQQLLFEREWFADRLGNFFSDRRDIFGFGQIGDDHQKFIAAEAADHIGATQTTLQSAGNTFQQFVARIVAERIVDGFEIIEIDEQHPHQRLLSPCTGQHHLQAIHQQRAIRQVGKRIVMRHELDARFGLFAIADIANGGHANGPSAVHNVFADDFGGEFAAVGPQHRRFVGPLETCANIFLHYFARSRRNKILGLTAEQLCRRNTHHARYRLVAIGDHALIEERNTLVGGVGKFPQPLFAVANGLLRLPVACDVVDQDKGALWRAIAVQMRKQRDFNYAGFTVWKYKRAFVTHALSGHDDVDVWLDRCIGLITNDFLHTLAEN